MSLCSRTLKPLGYFLFAVIALAAAHWMLIRAYVTFCVPGGILGFIVTAFTIGSPVCIHINTVQTAVVTYYTQLWAAGAGGTCLWIANTVRTQPIDNFDQNQAKRRWNHLKDTVN